MAPRFGDFAKDDGDIDLEEGEYAARITEATILREPETGEPVESFGKNVCEVGFAIDGDSAKTRQRRFSISFGQNSQSGQWAMFAQLLAAACGVPCGAAQQRDLDTEDLEGKWVRVILQRQEKNGRSYLNVVAVLPPKRS